MKFMRLVYKFDTIYLADIEDEKKEEELSKKYDGFVFVHEIDEEEAKDELISAYLDIAGCMQNGILETKDFLDYLNLRNPDLFDWDKFLEDGKATLKVCLRNEAMSQFAEKIKKEG